MVARENHAISQHLAIPLSSNVVSSALSGQSEQRKRGSQTMGVDPLAWLKLPENEDWEDEIVQQPKKSFDDDEDISEK